MNKNGPLTYDIEYAFCSCATEFNVARVRADHSAVSTDAVWASRGRLPVTVEGSTRQRSQAATAAAAAARARHVFVVSSAHRRRRRVLFAFWRLRSPSLRRAFLSAFYKTFVVLRLRECGRATSHPLRPFVKTRFASAVSPSFSWPSGFIINIDLRISGHLPYYVYFAFEYFIQLYCLYLIILYAFFFKF